MSILERYIFSAGSNFLRAIFSFLTGLLIARGLGANDYGTFAFLLASLSAFISLIDIGASSAFFTFISKKLRSRSFFLIFLLWVFGSFAVATAFLLIIAPENWIESIWIGEKRGLVALAFVAVFLKTHVWNIVCQIAESQRFTKISQSFSLAISVIHFCLILLCFYFKYLEIDIILFIIILEFLVASLFIYLVLPIKFSTEHEETRVIFKDYWIYCFPLIPYVCLQLTIRFLDTWLLQSFGGAKEQAYYAIALQFSTVAIIATSSLIKVLWKEIAEANERKDYEKVEILYKRSTKILYAISSILCCLFIPFTVELITLTLGDDYLAGSFVMALMFLYPLHQTIGQINGSMYFSLEMTKSHSAIGSVCLILSFICSYFLLAPSDASIPGFELASKGLAFKMIIIQLLFVNFSTWYLHRKRKWKLDIMYQFTYPVLFISLSYGSYFIATVLLNENNNNMAIIACSSTIYFILCYLSAFLFPNILGLTKEEFKHFSKRITHILKIS